MRLAMRTPRNDRPWLGRPCVEGTEDRDSPSRTSRNDTSRHLEAARVRPSDEINGHKSTSNGYHTATLANGDKTTAHFHGTTITKDGKFQSGGGTWVFVSGTGKCKGIKGKGTYKGTPNTDGTVAYKVDGEYSLPK